MILISIDTLRADHLGCYGYPRPTSPNLDRTADEALLFERAYSQSANTLISHATMLTSLNPMSHGARPDRRLDEEITTLAEVFRAHGYRTAGFTAHPAWLSAKMGFAQGFDYFMTGGRPAPMQFKQALFWLRSLMRQSPAQARAPFLLFIHLYDVHSDFKQFPYETATPFDSLFSGSYKGSFSGCRAGKCASEFLRLASDQPQLLSPDELEWVKSRYDGGIAYTDHHLGVFLDELRRIGFMERSWLIVTSDHGEEFREHGRLLHSQSYEETARVPLIVRPPGGIARRNILEPVGLVDLLPTLAEAVGIRPESPMEGRSLLPLAAGSDPAPSPPIFWTGYQISEITVRTAQYMLVTRGDTTPPELYDNDTDVGQTRNVAEAHPRIARGLRDMVGHFKNEQLERAAKRHTTVVEPTKEDRERLKALGYAE